VFDNGLLTTGNGSDIVSASGLGFTGGGVIETGNGKDRIEGFGDIFVNGGNSKDTLILPMGEYVIKSDGIDFRIVKDQIGMSVESIESIGSLMSGATVNLAVGNLLVGSDGTLTFT
jgi:hypothetical protein